VRNVGTVAECREPTDRPCRDETRLLASFVGGGTFLADVISKQIAVGSLHENVRHVVIPGVLWWTLERNPHGAFGLFGSSPRLLVALAAVILLVFWFAFRREFETSRRARITLGLVVGGATGNTVDRLQHSSAVDFIDVATLWPNIFYVGDVAITLGAVALIVGSIVAGGARSQRASRRLPFRRA